MNSTPPNKTWKDHVDHIHTILLWLCGWPGDRLSCPYPRRLLHWQGHFRGRPHMTLDNMKRREWGPPVLPKTEGGLQIYKGPKIVVSTFAIIIIVIWSLSFGANGTHHTHGPFFNFFKVYSGKEVKKSTWPRPILNGRNHHRADVLDGGGAARSFEDSSESKNRPLLPVDSVTASIIYIYLFILRAVASDDSKRLRNPGGSPRYMMISLWGRETQQQ
jgi:hypothetical protein